MVTTTGQMQNLQRKCFNRIANIILFLSLMEACLKMLASSSESLMTDMEEHPAVHGEVRVLGWDSMLS